MDSVIDTRRLMSWADAETAEPEAKDLCTLPRDTLITTCVGLLTHMLKQTAGLYQESPFDLKPYKKNFQASIILNIIYV